jgi:septal ring factor EnvC (AmiA/AmiB activator)
MAQPINREHLKTILYDAEKLKTLDAQQSNINNAGIAAASTASAAAAAAAAAPNASLKRKQSEISDANGADGDTPHRPNGDAPQQQQVTRPAAGDNNNSDMMELDAMDAYEREAAGEGPDEDELAAMMELEG